MGADDFSVSSLFSNDLWILQAFETALLFFCFSMPSITQRFESIQKLINFPFRRK